MEQYHGTTILSVRRGNSVAMGGDGQVTLGNIVIKGTAKKVRRLYNGRILAGFAAVQLAEGTSDAISEGADRAENLVTETSDQVSNDASEGLDEASNNVAPDNNRRN